MLLPVEISAQEDYNIYREAALKHLQNRNKEKAKIAYGVYVDLTKKKDPEIERLLYGNANSNATYKTIEYTNGDKYEGYTVNGVREGQGTSYYANGDKFVGEFKNDRRNGQGSYYYADGSKKYEGGFKNDLYEGEGTYFFKNGDRYVGDFKNDKYEGQGTYYFADGRSRSGTWKEGEFIE